MWGVLWGGSLVGLILLVPAALLLTEFITKELTLLVGAIFFRSSCKNSPLTIQAQMITGNFLFDLVLLLIALVRALVGTVNVQSVLDANINQKLLCCDATFTVLGLKYCTQQVLNTFLFWYFESCAGCGMTSG